MNTKTVFRFSVCIVLVLEPALSRTCMHYSSCWWFFFEVLLLPRRQKVHHPEDSLIGSCVVCAAQGSLARSCSFRQSRRSCTPKPWSELLLCAAKLLSNPVMLQSPIVVRIIIPHLIYLDFSGIFPGFSILQSFVFMPYGFAGLHSSYSYILPGCCCCCCCCCCCLHL